MIRFAIAALVALSAAAALAQDKPTVKDAAAIESCMKKKTGRHWAWEQCIGLISEPCAKNEERMSSSQVSACYERERAVWDDVLNKSYRRLRETLDKEQVEKMQDMQRSWMTARDKTCGFIYDYFEGTMANPMIAACVARATGMQALFLRGFADDAADRK